MHRCRATMQFRTTVDDLTSIPNIETKTKFLLSTLNFFNESRLSKINHNCVLALKKYATPTHLSDLFQKSIIANYFQQSYKTQNIFQKKVICSHLAQLFAKIWKIF